MRPANIFHLGIKELRSLMRDPVMIVLIVYAFSLAIYSAATATPETLHKAPIAVIDEDRSQLSTRIRDAFYPPLFSEPKLISHSEMDSRMDAGLDTFALDFPPDFQQDVLAGRTPSIQLSVDATRMSQALVGSGYVQSIISREISDFLHNYQAVTVPNVDLVLRARFNPNLSRIWFGGAMELINEITMLAVILTGAALIREREHGTVEHLLVMPITPFEIMTGKLWAMTLVVLAASACALFIVIRGALKTPIEGSIVLFMAGASLDLFATTSLGFFLGTIARSMPQFGLLAILVLVPMQILSGASSPRESMPKLVQEIMLVAPNTHFVMLAQAILFRGAGFSTVWPNFAALVLIGAILFAISLGRFRKTIGQMA